MRLTGLALDEDGGGAASVGRSVDRHDALQLGVVEVQSQFWQHTLNEAFGGRKSLAKAPPCVLRNRLVLVLDVECQHLGQSPGHLTPHVLVGVSRVGGDQLESTLLEIHSLPLLNDGLVQQPKDSGRLERPQSLQLVQLKWKISTICLYSMVETYPSN